MSIQKYFFKSILILTVTLVSISGFSQEGRVTVKEDPKVSELLALKNKMSKENKLSEGFTIQLYYGELNGANSVIRNYKRMYTDWPATVIYESPNYKVWVGNFLTRLEADRALMEIQKEFESAFVFKPERRN